MVRKSNKQQGTKATFVAPLPEVQEQQNAPLVTIDPSNGEVTREQHLMNKSHLSHQDAVNVLKQIQEDPINVALQSDWTADHQSTIPPVNSFFGEMFKDAPGLVVDADIGFSSEGADQFEQKLDTMSIAILQHFNEEEIGSAYTTYVTPELKNHLFTKSNQSRQFSNLEHSVRQIKNFDPDTKLFQVEWKDSLEFSSSVEYSLFGRNIFLN